MSESDVKLALRIGDSALILAQQNSQWCGKAPSVEEDVALANTALDLIGQAQLWLGYAGEKLGKSADELAYRRDSNAFLNVMLCEQKNGDYGNTIMRQYLFDSWHKAVLLSMQNHLVLELNQIAKKSIKEVSYHLRRSRDLVMRLGQGSEVSIAKMQSSIDRLWSSFGEGFSNFSIHENDEYGLDFQALEASCIEQIQQDLQQTQIICPEHRIWQKGILQGMHSENLGHILTDMQFLQKTYPNLKW